MKTKSAFFVSLAAILVCLCHKRASGKKPKEKPPFRVYWNIPTFQCDPHKIYFGKLAEKYNITQNKNDRFRGEQITILYDPGNFPAILYPEGSRKRFLRNGGVPQEGNLTAHLSVFGEILHALIPDEHFNGLGVIDFESWRPVFRQNFGSLAPYRELSIEVEKKLHPIWERFVLEREATKRFEFYGRVFMEETLSYAKSLRPNASWGYYAYPYCFNMSPNNMRKSCPNEVTKENNKISWLFELSDNFYPSIYLPQYRLTGRQKMQLIEGRLDESFRMIGYIGKRTPDEPKILPYFWYKYQDTRSYLSKNDLYDAFTAIKSSNVDGFIVWGSSNDVNNRNACLSLYSYIDEVFGPALVEVFNSK